MHAVGINQNHIATPLRLTGKSANQTGVPAQEAPGSSDSLQMGSQSQTREMTRMSAYQQLYPNGPPRTMDPSELQGHSNSHNTQEAEPPKKKSLLGYLRSGVRSVTGGIANAISFTNETLQKYNPLNYADEAVTMVSGTIASGLETIGADSAASSVRSIGKNVASGVEKAVDTGHRFINGAVDGLNGTIEGVGVLITDPIGTAKNIGKVIQDPSLLLDPYKELYAKEGAAGVAGSAVFDIASVLLTGGAGAAANATSRTGRIASAAGRAGSKLDDIAAAARAGSTRARVSETLARGARGAEGALNSLDGTLTRAGDKIGEYRDRLPNGAKVREWVESKAPDLPYEYIDEVAGHTVTRNINQLGNDFIRGEFTEVVRGDQEEQPDPAPNQ